MAAISPQFQAIRTLALPDRNVFDYYISPEGSLYYLRGCDYMWVMPQDYSIRNKEECLKSLIERVKLLPPEQVGMAHCNRESYTYNVETLCEQVWRKFQAFLSEEALAINEALEFKRNHEADMQRFIEEEPALYCSETITGVDLTLRAAEPLAFFGTSHYCRDPLATRTGFG